MRSIVAAIRAAVTRGKVMLATFAAVRTALQVALRYGETKDKIELMLPYGMSAIPLAGDVLLLQIGGQRDHAVALCADDPSLRIPDLQPGEFGFRDARQQQIVFRLDRIEVTTPLKLVATITGDCDLTIGGNLNCAVTGNATIDAATITLAGGGPAVARVGDQVICPAGTGAISTGSTKVNSG